MADDTQATGRSDREPDERIDESLGPAEDSLGPEGAASDAVDSPPADSPTRHEIPESPSEQRPLTGTYELDVPDMPPGAAPADEGPPDPPRGLNDDSDPPASRSDSWESPPARSHRRSGGKASVDRPARNVGEPPRRQDRLAAWAVLVGILLLAAVPMSIDLLTPDVTNPNEARTLATSAETWRRYVDRAESTGFTTDLLIPVLNHEPHVVEPPGTTWMHMTLFASLDPDTATAEDFILVGRWAAVAFGLIVVASVFWIGHSIGGLRTASLSALVCAACPLLVLHARLATPDIHHTGLSMLAIAAAVWAIRPLKPSPSTERQFIGWVLCGLALGAATLAGGFTAFIMIMLPVFALLLLCPGRTGHLMGLIAALIIGVLLILPWALFAQDVDSMIFSTWFDRETATTTSNIENLGNVIGRRASLLVVALVPWTLWLAGAVVQPFSTSSKGRRTRLFLGWTWFAVAVLVLLTRPRSDHFADLLPLVPPLAVLLGQLFNRYTELAQAGHYANFWRALRWIQLLLIGVATLMLPLMLRARDGLSWGDLSANQMFEDLGWVFSLVVGLILIVPLVLSLRWALLHYPARVIVCWAIWALGVWAAIAVPVARGPLARDPRVNFAKHAAATIGDSQIYWLSTPTDSSDPHPAVALYTARAIPTITREQMVEMASQSGTFYVIGPEDWSDAGVHGLAPYGDSYASGLRLWRHDGMILPDERQASLSRRPEP